MEMVTFLSPRAYVRQYDFVRTLRSRHFHIYPGPECLFTFIYFFFIALRSDTVVIQIKKRHPGPIDLLRRIFPSRIRYIIEMEGDFEYERDYLRQHPYRPGFYDRELAMLTAHVAKLKTMLGRADHVFVVSDSYRASIAQRYPDLCLMAKTSLMPVSYDDKKLAYSEERRRAHRRKLNLGDRLTLIYIGNAYYSWQNVKRTLQVFTLIKRELRPDAFLMLLVNREDHSIVREFIAEERLGPDDYLLGYAQHDEISDYLCAADIGVMLRHDHPMNEILCLPGKLVDYLACGLPVLVTRAIQELPETIRQKAYGLVLDDMDDDREVLAGIGPLLTHDAAKRREISAWAKGLFAADRHIQSYVDVFTALTGAPARETGA